MILQSHKLHCSNKCLCSDKNSKEEQVELESSGIKELSLSFKEDTHCKCSFLTCGQGFGMGCNFIPLL